MYRKEGTVLNLYLSELKDGMLIQYANGTIGMHLNGMIIGPVCVNTQVNKDKYFTNTLRRVDRHASSMDIVKVSKVLPKHYQSPCHWNEQMLESELLWKSKYDVTQPEQHVSIKIRAPKTTAAYFLNLSANELTKFHNEILKKVEKFDKISKERRKKEKE